MNTNINLKKNRQLTIENRVSCDDQNQPKWLCFHGLHHDQRFCSLEAGPDGLFFVDATILNEPP